MHDGPQKILDMANKMGIPPAKADPKYPGIPNTSRDLDADALITLGKARISAINMANTYATIANGGQRADVHVISKVVDSKGKVLYSSSRTRPRRSSPTSTATSATPCSRWCCTAPAPTPRRSSRPAAGKTGTATNSHGDVSSSWFVGFTPQLATAVMYVRGDGDNALDDWLPPYNGAAGYFGAGYPTATWAAVMKADLVGVPVEKFPPAGERQRHVATRARPDHGADAPAAAHAATTRSPRAPTSSAPTVQRRRRCRRAADGESRRHPTITIPTCVRAVRRPATPTAAPPTTPAPTPRPPVASTAPERDGLARALVVTDRAMTRPVIRPTPRRPGRRGL